MKDTTAAGTTTGVTGKLPGTSPMNLTCTTVPAGMTADATPSQVCIAINPSGPAPGPPDNTWQTWVAANGNVQYEIVDQGGPDPKPHWQIKGTGVAIYYK